MNSNYKYMGCYVDGALRDLAVWLKPSSKMTVQMCYKHCKARGYKYFSLQASSHCFCDNSYGKYGSDMDSKCNMRCSGNSRQMCGAGMRNSVYLIKGASKSFTICGLMAYKAS
jgi:hypothetical protein